MARILSIDYGKKRTGLAVTDPLQIIAGGLTTVDTRELLKFLLEYGDEKLIFDKDSRFYVSGEESSVAEFILDTLDGNALKFRNSRYSLLLDEYTRLFDSGLPQASILARLPIRNTLVMVFLLPDHFLIFRASPSPSGAYHPLPVRTRSR